jgi:polyphosphate kinase
LPAFAAVQSAHLDTPGPPADWTPRDLDRRVEIAFPVLDPELQAGIREILEMQLADTVKARRILADGSSERIPTVVGRALRSQQREDEVTGANVAKAATSLRGS